MAGKRARSASEAGSFFGNPMAIAGPRTRPRRNVGARKGGREV